MTNQTRVIIPLEDLKSSPESSDFEGEAFALACGKIGVDPDAFRVKDIAVEGEDAVVFLVSSEDESMAEVQPPSQQAAPMAPEPEEEEWTPIPLEESVAYQGPMADAEFEVDVVDMCALMDVLGFTTTLMQQAGATSPSVARSIAKLNNMLAENVGQEIPLPEGAPENSPRQAQLKPEFTQHMEAWMRESKGEFDRVVQQQKSKVVTAHMMPDENFDPRGPQPGHPGRVNPAGGSPLVTPGG